ncbi:YceI family protein [Coraliomargarita algicola]|uniref:YceI family protein n=1 Tax=Coraliomargarita algicola TaxID=3092156 RepID=A0ABZ0RMR6_9BACT|nr:YceI family protein [Coraliomargarita sp. J2-16]WPJ94234.1 YceI family protein [Coraliomargarita sp. J2-16]
MKKTILLLTSAVLASLIGHAAEVETYVIDTSHSSVKFSIRHFVAKTTGNFSEFEGTLTINRDDLSQNSVEATIQIPSVDTDSDKRDAHLQEDDYFNAAKHPLMTFKSTQWKATEDENQFKVTGDLSFNGITKPVTLDVELLGFGEGMRGKYLSGWEATTTLDRTEWGVNGGQPAVGNEVNVTINIEAHRQ